MGISGWQLILVLVLVFVLFGAGKLPRVMGDLGKGIRSMKDGLKGEEDASDGDDSDVAVQKVNDKEKKMVSADKTSRVIDVQEQPETVDVVAKKPAAKKKVAQKTTTKSSAKTKSASAKKASPKKKPS